jgi:hypothetical protein
MAEAYRHALINMLAKLDQLDAGIEAVHAACVGTPLEGHADIMRESTWEMRGAVEAALRKTKPPSHN